MENKTFEDFREVQAKAAGFKSWDDLCSRRDCEMIANLSERAAIRFADYREYIGKESGWSEGYFTANDDTDLDKHEYMKNTSNPYTPNNYDRKEN